MTILSSIESSLILIQHIYIVYGGWTWYKILSELEQILLLLFEFYYTKIKLITNKICICRLSSQIQALTNNALFVLDSLLISQLCVYHKRMPQYYDNYFRS